MKKSIAVLPFINRSVDPHNEYFSDGMTEEIINALSKIEGLKVTSRTSSFYFKNRNIPLKEIGKALEVSTIVEGSIRLWKNKMRITARLVDVAEDMHFWSETFNRSVEDVFAVQDEISMLIADKLREHLGHFIMEEHLVERPQVPVNVYKRYLESRYHILKMTKPAIMKGIAILESIIKVQPGFALAHLGMHLGYTLLGTIGLMPASDAFAKGQPFFDKAVALDADLPECQLHLSYIAFLQEWDLPKAYQHLNKSFEIRPSVEYYQSMASMLVAERKLDASLNYIETALQLDPFAPVNHHLKGFVFYASEKYEQAIASFSRALELNAHFMASTLYKGQALLLAGKLQEGLAYFQGLPADEQNDVMKLGGTTLAYAALGNSSKAAAGIVQLEQALQTTLTERALNLLILCHSMMGNNETALQLIEKGISYRLPMLAYLYVDPILKQLRTNLRFQGFMKQVLGDTTSFSFSKRKYKKTLLDETALQQYKQRLERVMSNEKPYLDPDLTLRRLAALLDLPPNYLSQLLNEGFGKNFSEFINLYRLEAFKIKARDPSNSHITLLGLAYESGFNSKTVFNTFFKKKMGKTPKTWWRTAV